jgi:hypothetical protein
VGWTITQGLNEQADLQAKNTQRSAYLVVLTESKKDLGNKFDYREYARRRLSKLQKSLEEVQGGDSPVEMTVGGRSAIHFQLDGVKKTDDGDQARLWYSLTVVDGVAAVHQIFAWTLFSKAGENKLELDQIVKSFEDRSK